MPQGLARLDATLQQYRAAVDQLRSRGVPSVALEDDVEYLTELAQSANEPPHWERSTIGSRLRRWWFR